MLNRARTRIDAAYEHAGHSQRDSNPADYQYRLAEQNRAFQEPIEWRVQGVNSSLWTNGFTPSAMRRSRFPVALRLRLWASEPPLPVVMRLEMSIVFAVVPLIGLIQDPSGVSKRVSF